MGTNLRINADRLWDSLMDMAKIGATEKGGVCRLALTDLDKLFHLRITDPAERERFSFTPGQFVMLELPGFGAADRPDV